MLGSELADFLKKLPLLKRHFCGVFAADQAPHLRLKVNKTFVIANTDVHDGDGQHWFLIMRVNHCLELFDSLGLTESVARERVGNVKCIYNESAVQAESSIMCGLFCIYFAYSRLTNADESFSEAEQRQSVGIKVL
jgi:hypothetical protein